MPEQPQPAEARAFVERARPATRRGYSVERPSDVLIDALDLIQRQAAEIASLAKFKAYVHRRLDEAGVPADPDSPHKAEGCRIGGRLDIVLAHVAEIERLRARVGELEGGSI